MARADRPDHGTAMTAERVTPHARLRARRLRAPRRNLRRGAVVSIAWLAVLPGCAGRLSTFELIDCSAPNRATRYEQTFDEAYYDIDGGANVDIVLRRTRPGVVNPKEDITQIIHIRTVWRSIPGITVAERTQINGIVNYHMFRGDLSASLEGAGSVFLSRRKRDGTLEGSLELAILRPLARVAEDGALFRRARLSGEFIALRDARKVARILNEAKRRCPSTTRRRNATSLRS